MTLDEIYAIDDLREFWTALKQRWAERHEKVGFGFDGLTEGERRLARMQDFGWQLRGNGVCGWLGNDPGYGHAEIIDDLELIGAPQLAELIREYARRAFPPDGVIPEDFDERNDKVDALTPDDEDFEKDEEAAAEWEEAEHQYDLEWSDRWEETAEALPELLAQYAKDHRPHFE